MLPRALSADVRGHQVSSLIDLVYGVLTLNYSAVEKAVALPLGWVVGTLVFTLLGVLARPLFRSQPEVLTIAPVELRERSAPLAKYLARHHPSDAAARRLVLPALATGSGVRTAFRDLRGLVVSYRVTLDGTTFCTPCVVSWSLRDATDARAAPLQRGRAWPKSSFDLFGPTESATRETWIPLPQRAGTYVVAITVTDKITKTDDAGKLRVTRTVTGSADSTPVSVAAGANP